MVKRISSGLCVALCLIVGAHAAALAQPRDIPPPPILEPEIRRPVPDSPPDNLSDIAPEGAPVLPPTETPLLDIPRPNPQAHATPRIGVFALLHKVSAKIQEIRVPLNEPTRIDALTIIMRYCRSSPPEDPPETRVFVEISEDKAQGVSVLFTGWMFASSPSIHALEHPVYDLWPRACQTPQGAPYTGD